MQQFMKFYSLYARLLSLIAVFAGIATFAMMWLVDANVIGRKFLNTPVMGSVEISQSLLVFSIMLGLPFAQATGAHLRVTVLIGKLSQTAGRYLYTFAMLAGFVVFALLAWSSWGFMLRAYNVGEQVWGAAVRFPLWPVKAAIPLGAALLSLQFALDAIRVGWFNRIEPRDDIVPYPEGSAVHE